MLRVCCSVYKLNVHVNEADKNKPLHIGHFPQILGSESTKVAHTVTVVGFLHFTLGRYDQSSILHLHLRIITFRMSACQVDLGMSGKCRGNSLKIKEIPGRCREKILLVVVYCQLYVQCYASVDRCWHVSRLLLLIKSL